MAGGKAAGSGSSSAVAETKAQVKLLERMTTQGLNLIRLKLQSAKAPNRRTAWKAY